jgi:hypothetical protein
LQTIKNILDSKTWAQAVALIMSIAILLWLTWSATSAVPHADDFCYGMISHAQGILQNVIASYQAVNGRYASTLLVATLTNYPDLVTHYLFFVPWAILLILAITVHRFLHSIDVRGLGFYFLTMVFIVGCLHWWETILWLTGGVTYSVSFAILLWLFSQEIAWFGEYKKPNLLSIIFVGFSSIILAGFNETVMVAHLGFLSCCLFGLWIKGRARSLLIIFLVIFLCALVGALIVKFAPGNTIRAQTYAAPNAIFALIKSFLYLLDVGTIPLLVATGFFLCALHLFAVKPSRLLSKSLLWQLGVFFLLTTMSAIFTRVYAQGDLGPWRAQSLDYLLTAISALFFALFLYEPNKSFPWKSSHWKSNAFNLLAVLLLMALHTNPDGKWWRTLVSMRLDAGYQNSLQPYLTKALNSPGQVLLIPNYVNSDAYKKLGKPRTMFLRDFTSDPDDWTNKCFAQFYGLHSVRIED